MAAAPHTGHVSLCCYRHCWKIYGTLLVCMTAKERRLVLASLAETCHLAQLFLSFPLAPVLVLLVGDRAMSVNDSAWSPDRVPGW